LGFIKKLGRKINKTANQFTSNLTKKPLKAAQQFAEFRIGGLPIEAGKLAIEEMQPKPPPEPTPNTQLEALRKEMSDDAKNFRANIDGYKSEKIQGLLPSYDMAKEEGVRRTRENYSRRGLLYSGLGQKGDAEARGAVQGEFNRAVAGINQEAEGIATRKEKAAASIGLEQMGLLMNQAEQYYNMSAENDIARRKALGSLASGFGYAAGAYAGRDQSQGLLQPGSFSGSGLDPQPSRYGTLLGVNYG
jgi:hypothetical protein